jgi:hypothetical protein
LKEDKGTEYDSLALLAGLLLLCIKLPVLVRFIKTLSAHSQRIFPTGSPRLDK